MVETLIDAAELLGHELARRLERRADSAIAARGRFSLALPGGSVASAFLPALAVSAIDWSRTDVFWGDERAVPASHPDRNDRLARELLLHRVPIPAAGVHALDLGDGDVHAAALRYEAELLATLGQPPALDVALLGVGPDGHVCSLFPGHAALQESSRWVVGITDSPKPPPARVTLTLSALAAAHLLVVAAFGAAKAPVMREAREDPSSPLPVAHVLRAGPPVLLLLDPEAAGGD